MAADELKQAEQRGYSKGYAAGQRRAEREDSARKMADEQRAFWREVFMGILPMASTQDTWTLGDKRISTPEQRMNLAALFADAAVKELKKRGY